MSIYMVGIGGIGMSALAQLYHARGERVSGEDKVAGPTTELLQEKGIIVYIGEGEAPEDTALVIFSDAIPAHNKARANARARGIRELSYFQALGEVSRSARTIAVAGTHGKTTTTAMLAKILIDAGKRPTVIVGSLMKDFGSNFVAGDPNLLVVEACEYRDHVLELTPDILVLTNIEWDHTDWFVTEAALRATFERARQMAKTVIDADVYQAEPAYATSLIGDFNRDNARAAAAAAKAAFPDISPEHIARSLKEFQGTWRRFERVGTTREGAVVFDDYAHHPTAVRKTLEAARADDPRIHTASLVVVFQPHLYTRTRDLMQEFAAAFGAADQVIVAPIYGAREAPIPGITNETLAAAIEAHGTTARAMNSFSEIETYLHSVSNSETRIITMGAGDVYTIAKRLIDPVSQVRTA